MLLKNILIICCCLPVFLNAQSPYGLNWKKESVILGTGVAMLTGGMILHYNTAPLTTDEILALDRANTSPFDRNATFNLSPSASDASDVFLLSSHALPFLFLTNKKSRTDFGKIMLLYAETLIFTEGLTNLTKRIVKRPRPFVYNELADLSKKQRPQARYSFFSGHTSVTSANYFFVAKVFSDYYPDSKIKPFIWATAAIAPALTGYLRVKAGKHFYSDVITGYTVGALIGFMVPHLHKIQKNKSLSIIPAPTGILISWRLN